MKSHWRGLMAACSAAALLAIGIVSLPEPAHAQFGGIAGMLLGHMGGYHYYRGRGGCGRHCRGGHDDDSSDSDSNSDSRKDKDSGVRLTLAAPSSKVENAVLQIVAALNVSDSGNGAVELGTTKDVNALGKTASKEGERDWTGKVEDIIKKFRANQDKRVTTPGDVTEHAIEQSLDSAIKSAKLDTFERFLGENWSSERLRVMVLDRVWADVDTLFRGNSLGYAPMQDVNNLVQKAAQATYRRIFEVSELMAANRSSALFVQRLYQTHGGLVDDQLREVADDMITRASSEAIGKFDAGLRQDENGYALHYRAERIVFDCLSENVEKISSSETGIATNGEIQQKIENTGKGECVGWLDHQFGMDNRSITPQKPMPLRVVWSATGPKDDPSMYGRATDDF